MISAWLASATARSRRFSPSLCAPRSAAVCQSRPRSAVFIVSTSSAEIFGAFVAKRSSAKLCEPQGGEEPGC